MRLPHVDHQRMAKNYLIRRNGRYSFRRRYPREVASVVGRTEFVQALGTADPKEAARLARAVNAKFDIECDLAVRASQSPPEPSAKSAQCESGADDESVATAVFDRLPAIIRTVTLGVIADQSRNVASWHDTLAWKRRALEAHIAGEMPVEIQMHPLVAVTALKALDAAASGRPLIAPMDASNIEYVVTREPTSPATARGLLTEDKLNIAASEYAHGKSHRRKLVALRSAKRTLLLPCSKEDASKSIGDWCAIELRTSKRVSSIWTEASAVIAMLKFIPGWSDFRVEKVGELRALRGAGRASVSARMPMPVSMLHSVLNALPAHLPNNGQHWYAALVICALYGLRPGELLQSGPEALQLREDIFGNKALVFRVGMQGAKNRSSERDLPVSMEVKPIFKMALSKGKCGPETARTRVERLNSMIRRTQADNAERFTLYSVRHLFADIARACKVSDAEIGPIMGHSSKGSTAVYGGKAPLVAQSEIIEAVQSMLFPSGLATVWPPRIQASQVAT